MTPTNSTICSGVLRNSRQRSGRRLDLWIRCRLFALTSDSSCHQRGFMDPCESDKILGVFPVLDKEHAIATLGES